MAKKSNTKLEEFLELKMKIKALEEKAKALSDELFAEPENLPDNVVVRILSKKTKGIVTHEFQKIEKTPTSQISAKMIELAGMDINNFAPFATYPVATIIRMVGESGFKKIKRTKEYKRVMAGKKSIFYYKKVK